MEMRKLNEQRVCEILNEIVELEMAGVVRYAHSSLMVTGPYRLPIVQFLQEQATETNASQEELEIQSSESLPEQTEPKDSPSAES